jgi:hypothetical protein
MIAFTSKVFGRTSSRHPYEAALIDWQRSGDVAKMAMACNIRHDHRVSPSREEKFNDFCNQPRSATELEEAINHYFNKKVRTRDYPHFVYYEINAENLIYGHAKLAEKLAKNLRSRPDFTSTTSFADDPPLALHKEQKLLRILDLNNLRRPFQWLLDKSHRKPEWKDSFRLYYEKFPRDLTKDEVKEQEWIDCWLNKMLDTKDKDRQESFVGAVLDMLNCNRRGAAFQPTWATIWQAFEPHARTPDGDPNPDRWVQMMGMGKNPPGHWFIALTYMVAEAGTLARPTQLDGGWYEYHFPSPKETPREFGGQAMDLQLPPVATTLLPEYIHKQIEHPLKHWDDTERLLGRTSNWHRPGLIDLRRAHQKKLASTYETDAYTNCPHRAVCKIC